MASFKPRVPNGHHPQQLQPPPPLRHILAPPSPPPGSLRILFLLYCFTTIFFSFGWFIYHTVPWHLKDFDVGH
jgi:hypothetical protein